MSGKIELEPSISTPQNKEQRQKGDIKWEERGNDRGRKGKKHFVSKKKRGDYTKVIKHFGKLQTKQNKAKALKEQPGKQECIKYSKVAEKEEEEGEEEKKQRDEGRGEDKSKKKEEENE